MNIEERRAAVEPIEVLEDVPLDESSLEKFTEIGTSMEEKRKQDLVQFFKKSTDVFAWSHKDMHGIDLTVITHCHGRILEVKPNQDGRGRPGENILHHKLRFVLLQSNVFWSEKCRSCLSETGQPHVSSTNWVKC